MPGPRPETQEQVDETGERGLSPLLDTSSGQSLPSRKPQHIPHTCACVCVHLGTAPQGHIHSRACTHITHVHSHTRAETHAAHAHTWVHRCSHVGTCVHVCTRRCRHAVPVCVMVVCVHTYHTCMQPHLGRHTNACVHMHMRGPTGPHECMHVGMCVYMCAHRHRCRCTCVHT